jgi:hypothetical protein
MAPRVLVALATEADDRFSSWDQIAVMQPEMFALGEIEIKFCYYAAEGALQTSRPFVATSWSTNTDDLAEIMRRGRANCACGCYVPIGDILEHALKEPTLQAIVIIGDNFSGELEAALTAARKLRDQGTRMFLRQQGRSDHTERTFKALAAASGGAYVALRSPQIERIAERLPGVLEAVTHYAIGGEPALEACGSEYAGLLLNQVARRIGQRR